MTPSLWQNLEHHMRNLAPFVTALLLLFLSLVPFRLPGYAVIAPMLTLTAIYYWGLYRPDLMPATAVFFIGLLQDLLSGVPIGLNTGIFLLVYGIVVTQRRYFLHESFSITWVSFMMVAAAASILQWAAFSLLDWTVHDPSPGVFQYLLTLVLYPCLAWVYAQTQQIVLRQA
ncbi:MAG: rod shape-determining protein MreD [Pseudomonadota bacterium]